MKRRWEHLSVEDLSHGQVVRKAINISIPEGRLSDEAILSMAKEAVQLIKEPTNAIIIFIWQPGQNVGQEFARAVVEFAPRGNWSLANTVATDNMGHHKFRLIRNDTK